MVSEVEPQFNTGLIESTIPPTAYIAGEYSPMSGTKRVSAPLFWKEYLPKPEVQNANPFDEMNCVTRGTENCFETDYKFQTGLNIDWSDRHIAKVSGTTHNGNYVNKPAEAVKEFGLVLEEEYPNKADTWDEYYKEIPLVIPIRAVKILKDYDFDKEYIYDLSRDNLYDKLQENPLGVTIRYVSSGNPEDILNPSGSLNHFVMIYGAKYGEYWDIYDSYEWVRGGGVVKRYAWNYQFGSVLRFFITNKAISNYMFKQNYPYLLVEGNEQKLGFFLDGKLIVDDWVKILVQSASRLKRYEPAIPLKLKDWNSVPHVNLKGETI